MRKKWWKSLTILGGVLIGAAQASQPFLPRDVAAKATAVAQGVGCVIAAAGARRAIARNGAGR